MRHVMWAAVAVVIVCGLGRMWGQEPMPGERLDGDGALQRALKSSSLTFDGKPFHAVVEIASAAAGAEYSGRVEVWWASAAKYRTVVQSPKFRQEKVVNGDRVWEKDTGDYYPRWLENFVLAVLDPVPVAKNFHTAGPQVSENCLKREDRPAGITDQATFAVICLSKRETPRLDYVLTFNYFMEFKDSRDFGSKSVARTFETRVLDYKPVVAHMTTLEELGNPPPASFEAPTTDSADRPITTAFVSTLTEESMVEVKPEIQWPPVREGKTEGYMIVYARTDRTGQVRETAKHNSDQPGLEQFGMEQALRYKFKPLVVNGVARQMEMPLVLHFTSRIENPIPELDDAASRKLITGCSVPHEISDPASAGQMIVIQIQVHDDGGIMTLGSSDRKIPVPALYQQFRGCRFAQYKQNGVPTAYHANLSVNAR